MITRIEGELVGVSGGRCHLRCGHITYELLLPAADEMRLGQMMAGDVATVAFHTLHYLEGQGQGTSFTPRLIGFSSREDIAFFELFTTVKGMGNRKALRALQLPFGRVAEAIAARDVDTLKSLPEIGKRTAETIVAELHGKVDRFIEIKPRIARAGGSGGAAGEDGDDQLHQFAELARDAVAVLTMLGESKLDATLLVERALSADPELSTPDALVAAAFKLKATVA